MEYVHFLPAFGLSLTVEAKVGRDRVFEFRYTAYPT